MKGENVRRWPALKAALVILALIVALAAIPIVPIAAFLAYDAMSLRRFLAQTPFVDDLGGSTNEDQKRHFAERVAQAFPVGTRVDVLRKMLTDQGFSASRAYGGFDDRLQVEHGRFPCGVAWNVLWSAEEGAITAVEGDMRLTCL